MRRNTTLGQITHHTARPRRRKLPVRFVFRVRDRHAVGVAFDEDVAGCMRAQCLRNLVQHRRRIGQQARIADVEQNLRVNTDLDAMRRLHQRNAPIRLQRIEQREPRRRRVGLRGIDGGSRRAPGLPRKRLIPRIERVVFRAKLDGLLAFESMDVSGIHPFARRGLELLANGVSTAVLEDALQRELDAYERSRLAAVRVWQQAGGYAPTFGILGSVLGLVQVTSHILEPAQLGPGIAVAFIATLYGLAFANLVFLPLYGKLRAQIDSEMRFRKLYLDGLLAISRKESPHTIETRLTGDVRGRAAESLA